MRQLLRVTKDMPTGHNSVIYKDSFPQVDAASIMILRHAGALIFGNYPYFLIRV